MKKATVALFLLAFSSSPLFAQSADELLKKAAKFEKEHRYGQAFGVLNKIVREHAKSKEAVEAKKRRKSILARVTPEKKVKLDDLLVEKVCDRIENGNFRSAIRKLKKAGYKLEDVYGSIECSGKMDLIRVTIYDPIMLFDTLYEMINYFRDKEIELKRPILPDILNRIDTKKRTPLEMVWEKLNQAEQNKNESAEKELAKYEEYLLEYGATTEHLLGK